MNKTQNSRKALLLLYEGVASTIFNSQVAEHVADMKKLKIDFDILSYDTWGKTWEASNLNLAKFNKSYPGTNLILKKGINIFLPIINFYNIILFTIFIITNRNKYSFIHARGDYSAFVAILTKFIHKIPVIWDCRGDSLDELSDSLSRKNIFIKFIGFLFFATSIKMWVYLNTKFADKAIFVSDALKNHYLKYLSSSKFKTIPCPVSELKFFFNENLRIEKRNELNIREDDIVFMYSGSMIGYQYIEGLKIIFEDLMKIETNIILIVTTDLEKAKEIFRNLLNKKILILESSFDKIVSFYNAADFGILLREDKKLNFVASPTKFGEYSLSGLPVLMNDTVEQSFSLSKLIGNYISYKNLPNIPFTIKKRQEISEKAKKFYARKELNHSYIELYNS